MKRALLAAGVLCTLAVGCAEEARQDAPVGEITDDPVRVVQMPDQFPNIAYTCTEYGDLIYTTTRQAGNNMTVLEGGCNE